MDITSFSGEHRFLSNFWPCTVTLDGEQFPSVEHAYQAAKTDSLETRAHIRSLTAGQAKRFTKAMPKRADWSARKKRSTMRGLLEQKFSVEPCRSLLIATYPFHLEEGNTWGDSYWGVSRHGGQNHLGRMLMEIRDELIKGQQQ